MFDQTQMKQLMQAAEQACYACAHQTCLIHGCPNEQNIAHQTREQKKCLWTVAYQTCLMRACVTRLLSGFYRLFDLCLIKYVSNLWNSLPITTKQITPFSRFRKTLRKQIIDSYNNITSS